MSDMYVGQMIPFGGTFAIRDYAFCDGQAISIAQNQILFAVIGNSFGGNGFSTFNLPDLRGRSPVHFGQGPGLKPVNIGQMGGWNDVSLTPANLPPLFSEQPATSAQGTTHSPVGNIPASPVDPNTGAQILSYADSTTANGTLAPGHIGGGQTPIPIDSPYTGVNWQIVLNGLFPPRN